MKRIDLRGVIVGSSYDADWAAPYIAKGRFTPDSHFRRLLAEAGGDDVEVYVCSQGGDVTAGYEIANAIKTTVGVCPLPLLGVAFGGAAFTRSVRESRKMRGAPHRLPCVGLSWIGTAAGVRRRDAVALP